MAKPTLLFVAFFTALLIQGGQSTTFIINNNCNQAVWPATLSGHNSTALSLPGFELRSLGSFFVVAPAKWSGRIWARTQCSGDASGKFSCLTGDCGTGQVCANSPGAPPATLVEFTLQADGGKDFYGVSNVDGFNLEVSVTPKGVSGCAAVSCPLNVNAWCPRELQLKGPDGRVVGCYSACAVFNTDQYCCTGAYNSPSTCKPTKYSLMFKNFCPQALSYAFDVGPSILTCVGADYLITFCPLDLPV